MDEIVGAQEIAQRLNVQRATVDQWRQRPHLNFPPPDLTISGNPLWYWVTINKWGLESGRIAPPPPESAYERELRESREADR